MDKDQLSAQLDADILNFKARRDALGEQEVRASAESPFLDRRESAFGTSFSPVRPPEPPVLPTPDDDDGSGGGPPPPPPPPPPPDPEYPPPTVGPLTVDAGSDQSLPFGANPRLDGDVSYTGPDTLTITWGQDSGPDTAYFSDPTDPSTAVYFPAPGVYVLRLYANDGTYSASDSVTFTLTM